MSRWRRRDTPQSDPDPTERIAVPERSWQHAEPTGDATGDPDETRSLRDDLLAGRATEPAGGGPAEPAGPETQPTEWLGVPRPGPEAPHRAEPTGSPDTADPAGTTQVSEPPPAGWAHGPEPTDGPAAVDQPLPVDAAGRAAQRASAREEILGRVRAAVGGRPTPDEDVVRGYRRSFEGRREQAVDLFVERVADYHATVRRVPRDQLAATIAVCLVERGIRRIAVPVDLPGSWLPRYVQVSVDQGELTGADLDAVDGVITGCALGVAETGTIVLDGGRLQGRRLLSLVPDYHLCVVDALDVVGTLPEALATLDPARPLTFISGPSATSDIELDRVEGVHGPRTLDVLLTG